MFGRRTAFALGATLLMSGAALAQESKGLLVAIYKSGTQQYFIDQGAGFTAAAEELGYDAQVINVELDSNLAVSAVSDAIAAGAKGIAITVPDQSLGPAIATAAPVSSAAPATAAARSRAIGRPESAALSSPSVSMTRPRAA